MVASVWDLTTKVGTGAVLSNADKTATGNPDCVLIGTVGLSAGKKCFEIVGDFFTRSSGPGDVALAVSLSANPPSYGIEGGVLRSGGLNTWRWITNNFASFDDSNAMPPTTRNVWMLACDLDADRVDAYLDGTLMYANKTMYARGGGAAVVRYPMLALGHSCVGTLVTSGLETALPSGYTEWDASAGGGPLRAVRSNIENGRAGMTLFSAGLDNIEGV